jgi:hypothetical protein
MGANRTRFLANRRLQPLGHLSGSHGIIPELPNRMRRRNFFAPRRPATTGKSRMLLRSAGPVSAPEDSIVVSVVRRVNCW